MGALFFAKIKKVTFVCFGVEPLDPKVRIMDTRKTVKELWMHHDIYTVVESKVVHLVRTCYIPLTCGKKWKRT